MLNINLASLSDRQPSLKATPKLLLAPLTYTEITFKSINLW